MDSAFWVNPKRATVVQVMPWGNRNILVMANYTITESLSLLKLCLEEIKLFFFSLNPSWTMLSMGSYQGGRWQVSCVIIWKAALLSSLVPRPFPPPVFDCILYAKTEGEGLGERVTCMVSGRREGRDEGGGQKLEARTAWERGYCYRFVCVVGSFPGPCTIWE